MKRPDAKRCTQQTKLTDGTLVECGDVGGWTLDKARNTWRPSVGTDRSRRCWTHGPGSTVKPAGKGGRRKVQPNARMQHVAALLMQTAPEMTRAITEAHDELSTLGYPSSSSMGIRVTTDDDDGPVSRDVARAIELAGWIEDVRDAISGLENRANLLIERIRYMRNVRWAHGVKLCCDWQQGREGSIEWGDPTCTEIPTKRNLCAGCYTAERRWRVANGKPTTEVDAA